MEKDRINLAKEWLKEIQKAIEENYDKIIQASEFDLDSLYRSKEMIKAYLRKQKLKQNE